MVCQLGVHTCCACMSFPPSCPLQVKVPTWRLAAHKMLLRHARSHGGQLSDPEQQGEASTHGSEAGSAQCSDAGEAAEQAADGGAGGAGLPRSRLAVRNRITGLWEVAPAVEGRIRNMAAAKEGAQP